MPPELVFILQHIDTLSFLIVALWGHYKGIWKWSRDCKRDEECCTERGKAIDLIHKANVEKLERLEREREIEWQIKKGAQ